MKKMHWLMMGLLSVVLVSCVHHSYSMKLNSYAETRGKTLPHTVLGDVNLVVEIDEDTETLFSNEEAKGFRQLVIEKVKEQYPETEDVVNVTISLGASTERFGTFYVVEGVAIKYDAEESVE